MPSSTEPGLEHTMPPDLLRKCAETYKWAFQGAFWDKANKKADYLDVTSQSLAKVFAMPEVREFFAAQMQPAEPRP